MHCVGQIISPPGRYLSVGGSHCIDTLALSADNYIGQEFNATACCKATTPLSMLVIFRAT